MRGKLKRISFSPVNPCQLFFSNLRSISAIGEMNWGWRLSSLSLIASHNKALNLTESLVLSAPILCWFCLRPRLNLKPGSQTEPSLRFVTPQVPELYPWALAVSVEGVFYLTIVWLCRFGSGKLPCGGLRCCFNDDTVLYWFSGKGYGIYQSHKICHCMILIGFSYRDLPWICTEWFSIWHVHLQKNEPTLSCFCLEEKKTLYK